MKTCLLLIMLFLAARIEYPQVNQSSKLGSDNVFNLPEVGALIVQFKNTNKVQLVAPVNFRLAPYKNIDLRKDDIILTVNGQTVKKIADIKNAYDKLQVGQDFKLGIKRNKLTLACDILKGDPKNFPQKKSFAPVDDHMKNKVLITGLDVLIINVNEKPMINKFMNKDNPEIKKAGLGEGDLLTQLNNQPIKSFNQFKSSWESLGSGQDVIIRFNNTKSISFKKP